MMRVLVRAPTVRRCIVGTLLLMIGGCGSSEPRAPQVASAPKVETPKTPQPVEPAPTTTPETPKAPEPEPVAERCDAEWVCVRVSFAKKKVEKRETKLIGDPKIESTWSKSSDGRPTTFDAFSKGPVELTLRRKPSNKNEVVVKLGKSGEIVIDKRDGSIDDFTHVGAIAAEKDGDLLVDLRYMK